MNKNQFLVSAAVAGILSASVLTSSPAGAADAMGKCIAGNSCKAQGKCSQAKKNDCAGKNGCAQKGFIENTQADCKVKADAFAADPKNKGKKNPIHWEGAAPATPSKT